MRDLKTLKELVRSVTDCDSVQKMSGKPFRPSFIDVIMAEHSPQFYNKEQLRQVRDVSKLLKPVDSTPVTKDTHTVTKDTHTVTKKRKIEEISGEKSIMPKPKESRKKILTNNKTLPDFPAQFQNRVTELNGEEIKFLMHKTLYSSDTNSNSNRLSMPTNEIRSNFLKETEIATLNKRVDTNGKERPLGIEVTVLDPCLREFTLPLKRWRMERTETYNLIKNWKNIVSANNFEKGHELDIWSFRVLKRLYIVLHKV